MPNLRLKSDQNKTGIRLIYQADASKELTPNTGQEAMSGGKALQFYPMGTLNIKELAAN